MSIWSQSQLLHFERQSIRKEGLLGSDDKDVVGASHFKVCSGEVDSFFASVQRGVVALGSPCQKRLALALLTAQAVEHSYTTDALHSGIVGSWIWMRRRPATAILDQVFKVIPSAILDPDRPTLHYLSRKAAGELLVLSALAPVLVSSLAFPFEQELFPTDASLEKGGIASTFVEEELAKALWRSAVVKRSPVPVLFRVQGVL